MGEIDEYEQVQLNALACNRHQPNVWELIATALETWDLSRTERLILRALQELGDKQCPSSSAGF